MYDRILKNVAIISTLGFSYEQTGCCSYRRCMAPFTAMTQRIDVHHGNVLPSDCVERTATRINFACKPRALLSLTCAANIAAGSRRSVGSAAGQRR